MAGDPGAITVIMPGNPHSLPPMPGDPVPMTVIMAADPYSPTRVWRWAGIGACWCVISWTVISRIGVRGCHKCGRYRRRRPDYGARRGEWKEQGVSIIATLSVYTRSGHRHEESKPDTRQAHYP